MTSERDFDRLARAWLEQGPDEAPDRVIAAVLGRPTRCRRCGDASVGPHGGLST
jgi:hypothetical protein